MTLLEILISSIPFLIVFAVFLIAMRRIYRTAENFAKDLAKFVSDDAEALKRDWQMVGDDLRRALSGSGAEPCYKNVPMKEGERK